MKKYLLAALVVLSVSSFGAVVDNVTVFGGVNMDGKLGIDWADGTNEKYNADEIGYTVGVEAHKQVAKFSAGKLELGVGAKYDSSFINDELYEDGDIATTMPVYGSAKLSFKATKTTNIYLQGMLGYAFAADGDAVKDINDYYDYYYGGSAEMEGGMYTGIGLGVESGNYTVGLLYDITKTTLVVEVPGAEDSESDYDYSKVALTVGYKFGK